MTVDSIAMIAQKGREIIPAPGTGITHLLHTTRELWRSRRANIRTNPRERYRIDSSPCSLVSVDLVQII